MRLVATTPNMAGGIRGTGEYRVWCRAPKHRYFWTAAESGGKKIRFLRFVQRVHNEELRSFTIICNRKNALPYPMPSTKKAQKAAAVSSFQNFTLNSTLLSSFGVQSS